LILFRSSDLRDTAWEFSKPAVKFTGIYTIYPTERFVPAVDVTPPTLGTSVYRLGRTIFVRSQMQTADLEKHHPEEEDRREDIPIIQLWRSLEASQLNDQCLNSEIYICLSNENHRRRPTIR
jgi:hypothetical protein